MGIDFEHKRGDTFDFSGFIEVETPDGVLNDLTGWTAKSQVRTIHDVLVANLEVTWLDIETGKIRVRAQDTTAWPLCEAEIDIQLTSPGGDLVSTKTNRFEIVRDISR
jgi:hypothetical protein